MLQPGLAIFRNANFTRAILVLFLLICTSCARFPAELAPHGADKSIIAIKVKSDGFFGWLGGQPVIFFVRLQADGQNRQGGLLISNHRADGYAYLINVSAGRYAAIGAGIHSVSDNPIDPTLHSTSTSNWYFPASMIDETIVTVEPSEVAFMGEFEVSGDLGFDDADDTQKQYAKFLVEDADQGRSNRWWHLNKSSLRFIADYQKAESGVATERFMESSRGLEELGWHALDSDE